jgi:hypothetical protein
MNTAMTPEDFHSTIDKALDNALSEVMNAQALDLPALFWSCSGYRRWARDGVTGHTWIGPDPAPVTARRWADAFDLTESPTPMARGTVEYTGFIHGQPVTVWAVTDRDVFERVGRP